jgi:protein TonB
MKNVNNTYREKDLVSRKSSMIFIQFGLVFALLLTYIAIESKTLVSNETANDLGTILVEEDPEIPDTTPKPEIVIVEKNKQAPQQILKKIEIIDDNDDDLESIIDIIDVEDPVEPIKIEDIEEVVIKEEDPENVPINLVQEMPVYPGCTGTKEELKACLSKNIAKVVQRNFDSEIAQNMGLTPGVNRIFVLFVIDKNGNITDIKSNAPHKALQKEAIRVIKKLPKLQPGKFRGKNVGVKYSLPIKYLVED